MWIYIVRNKNNGKLYVGQTERVVAEERWKEHLGHIKGRRQQVIYSAMRKHGVEAFEFIPWEEWQTLEELDEAETFWIAFFRSWNPNFGYNRTMGGQQGRLTYDSCRRLSELNAGKRNPFYGQHHSDEAKAAIGRAQVGNKHGANWQMSDEQKQRHSDGLKRHWEQADDRRQATSERVTKEWKTGQRQAPRQAQKDQARDLLCQGLPVETVAEQTGLSQGTVYRVRNELGIIVDRHQATLTGWKTRRQQ